MEKCNSCDQMKKENSLARKALMDTNKNYVEVVNENLAKQREIDRLKVIVEDLNRLAGMFKNKIAEPSPFYGMPLCVHGIQFDCTECGRF